jgi:hypothetical protein
VAKVARRHEAVAAVVPGPARHEHSRAPGGRVDAVDSLRDGQPSELHELVDGESARAHELLVKGRGGLGRDGL